MKEKNWSKKNTEDNQRGILFNSSGEGALNEDNRASNDSKFAVENSSGNFPETFVSCYWKMLAFTARHLSWKLNLEDW